MKPSDTESYPSLPTSLSEQQWRAVLYALGEGHPDERLAFEQQLENDCALCEELIQATRLIELARLAPPSPIPSARPVRRHVYATIFALGSLALTLGLAILVEKQPAGVSNLADAILLTQVDMDPLSTPESESDAADNAGEELGPPDWLFTALELEEQSGTNRPGNSSESEI